MASRELYQELILEHSRAPRNHRKVPDADRFAEGDNPLCGDTCTVYLKLDGSTVADVAFEGQGCAISRASASIMTQAVKGRTTQEAATMFEGFHAMVTGGEPAAPLPEKLTVFRGVREFPARVKCASLAWHTLRAALEGAGGKVSTEEGKA